LQNDTLKSRSLPQVLCSVFQNAIAASLSGRTVHRPFANVRVLPCSERVNCVFYTVRVNGVQTEILEEKKKNYFI